MGKPAICERCRFGFLGFGDSFTDIKFTCRKGQVDFSSCSNDEIEKEIKKERNCSEYKSKYIEYPIEVSGIKKPEGTGIRSKGISGDCGDLVRVRPCGEKYENKTYIGILLGEADTGLMISHNDETKELSIHRHYNPAIFVPELKEIIYGYESWWGKIDSVEELEDILDEDIENVWYVKLLKEMIKE